MIHVYLRYNDEYIAHDLDLSFVICIVAKMGLVILLFAHEC